MSHEVESMFSVKETPWHGLGTILDHAPSIKEAITAAGLNWEVKREPLFFEDGTPTKSCAITRATDREIFGYTSPNYTPLQNKDAFEWFQPFVDSEAVTLETAGSLRKGAHVFILAKISKDPIVIVPKANDEVLQFLLLANGHDGTMAAHAGFTPVRVVCANTLSAAMGNENTRLMKAFHTSKVKDAMLAVRDVIDVATRSFQATAEQYKVLAAHDIDKVMLETYIKLTFFPKHAEPKRKDLVEADRVSFENKLNEVTKLFEEGKGNDRPGVRGTWWAAMNGVTEYLNYVRGRSADARLDSLWFGPAKKILDRALTTALELIRKGKK